MTEEQKIELERQANVYIFEFFYNRQNGYPTETQHAEFRALSWAIEVLGYEFVEDYKEIVFGVETTRYKIVEIKK